MMHPFFNSALTHDQYLQECQRMEMNRPAKHRRRPCPRGNKRGWRTLPSEANMESLAKLISDTWDGIALDALQLMGGEATPAYAFSFTMDYVNWKHHKPLRDLYRNLNPSEHAELIERVFPNNVCL